MTPPTTTTAKVPRGLPEEQPVELVGVSSRLGIWAVAILASSLAVEIAGFSVVIVKLEAADRYLNSILVTLKEAK